MLKKDIEKLKDEIRKVEGEFCRMAKTQGIKDAFLHYAAEDAVILRNNVLFRGITGINNYFSGLTLEQLKAELEWEPEFIDVSISGELAYSWGTYVHRVFSPPGEIVESRGTFHTVWKRQPDGNWKYVWD